MNIYEFAAKFDDESEGCITGVRNVQADLVLQLEIDDAVEPGVRRSYELHAFNVLETNAFPGWCGSVEFSGDHPLLWNYIAPWQDLYFTTAPRSAAEVIGVLYEVHERVFQGWRRLAEYLHLFAIQRSCNNGLLARGPEPVIAQYMSSVRGLLKVNAVKSHRIPQTANVLLLGDSFVICNDVSVTEVETVMPAMLTDEMQPQRTLSPDLVLFVFFVVQNNCVTQVAKTAT